MAASLFRLGVLTRRLTLKKNDAPIQLVTVMKSKIIWSNKYPKWNVITCYPLKYFHSSCTVRASSVEKKREERSKFFLRALEKKKREKVEVWRNMTVQELAEKIGRPPKDLLEILHNHIPDGHFYKSKNDVITQVEILRDVVRFMGKAPLIVPPKVEVLNEPSLDAFPRAAADPKDLVKRAPIVTIMGHVDHGKTTLLDYLRKANVVASEFGGITQHIGAFSVQLDENNKVTFIDTPGHAAFTAMRARGANATDIVVLVVAADDGVMEQTVESIRMAKEAGAPIIVAINKIDKPDANIRRTEEMLSKHEIYTENMGGDVQAVPISALNGTNIDTLIEAIVLQSEIMELKSDPAGLAEGVIVESKQDPHKGKLATAIIQRGTLRKGAVLVAGTSFAKVRLMFDEHGKQIPKAPPSTPVEMMGWRDLPAAGELMLEVESEKRAQQVINYRKSKEQISTAIAAAEITQQKQEEHRKFHHAKRREAYEQGHRNVYHNEKRQKLWVEDTTPRVKVLIKGDVDGSVEAILDVLETYDNQDVPLDIVHYGVGEVTPNDLELASTFKAIIYCFNLKTPPKLKDEAIKQKISIRNMNVIYHLVDDVKRELGTKMPMVEKENILGEADVLQHFEVSEKRKKLFIAGVRVKKGEIVKSEKARLIRSGTVLFDGPIASLRHIKNEVESMKSGTECGIMLGDSTIKVQLGDTIECYQTQLVQKTVDWDPGF